MMLKTRVVIGASSALLKFETHGHTGPQAATMATLLLVYAVGFVLAGGGRHCHGRQGVQPPLEAMIDAHGASRPVAKPDRSRSGAGTRGGRLPVTATCTCCHWQPASGRPG